MSNDYFDENKSFPRSEKLVLDGGVIVFGGQFIQFGLSVASTIVLSRMLDPGSFGLVAMVVPFLAVLSFFRDSGLYAATIQRENISHSLISTLFWINLAMAVSMALVLAFGAEVIALFFQRAELRAVVLVYAVIMVIGGLSIQHSALLARQMAFRKITIVSLVSQIFGILVAIACAHGGLKHWSLVNMALATATLQTILLWFFVSWVPGRPLLGVGLRQSLTFGSGVTFSNFCNQISQSIDGVLIGRSIGADGLGQYDRAKQLYLTPLLQVMAPLGNIAIPSLSRMVGDDKRYARFFLRIQEKLLMLTAIFSVLIVVWGDAVVSLLLGPQWDIAGQVLKALALGGLVVPVSATVTWLLMTQGRSADLAAWSPVSLVFRLLAILAGLPWGIVGVATSIAVFQYLSFAVFAVWVGRKGPVSSRAILANMAPSAIAAVVALVIGNVFKAMLLRGGGILVPILGVCLCGIVFFTTLWAVPAGRASLIDGWQLSRKMLGFN